MSQTCCYAGDEGDKYFFKSKLAMKIEYLKKYVIEVSLYILTYFL